MDKNYVEQQLRDIDNAVTVIGQATKSIHRELDGVSGPPSIPSVPTPSTELSDLDLEVYRAHSPYMGGFSDIRFIKRMNGIRIWLLGQGKKGRDLLYKSRFFNQPFVVALAGATDAEFIQCLKDWDEIFGAKKGEDPENESIALHRVRVSRSRTLWEVNTRIRWPIHDLVKHDSASNYSFSQGVMEAGPNGQYQTHSSVHRTVLATLDEFVNSMEIYVAQYFEFGAMPNTFHWHELTEEETEFLQEKLLNASFIPFKGV